MSCAWSCVDTYYALVYVRGRLERSLAYDGLGLVRLMGELDGYLEGSFISISTCSSCCCDILLTLNNLTVRSCAIGITMGFVATRTFRGRFVMFFI